MEIAIPIVALGALYVVSNHKDNKQSENFDNRLSKKEQELPNTHIPPVNYPVYKQKSIKKNINYYPSANAATDKYFMQEAYEKSIENDNTKFNSLTGMKVEKTALKHNNMVPFFGSHVTQRTVDFDNNESILDYMQGTDSQGIKKGAQAPLFKPEKNMGWANGSPNMSDFMQSRVNPSKYMSNVKPFETQNVGPGLAKGYTSAGSGGFNAGMEARERWIAKSVDELRTKNNPKITYPGVTLGGKRPVTNRGIEGKVEKYSPDTFYINSPDRYFTTTGVEKAPTVRSKEILRPENRTSTTREYFGDGAQENRGAYIPGEYRQPRRPQLKADSEYPGGADAEGRWRACENNSPCDYGRSGYKLLPNERTLTEERGGEFGGVAGSVIGAVVAPLLDLLRPSRKENVIGNLRPTGNMAGPSQMPVYNPADRPPVTARQTTAKNPYPMYINNQHPGGGYKSNPQQPTAQQRDSTNCEYIGNVGNTPGTSNPETYNAAYNANLNANKEFVTTAPRGNEIRQGNMNLFQGEQNVQVRRMDTFNDAIIPGVRGEGGGGGLNTYGQVSGRPSIRQGIECERTEPALLNAFKSNPYVQSLHSYA